MEFHLLEALTLLPLGGIIGIGLGYLRWGRTPPTIVHIPVFSEVPVPPPAPSRPVSPGRAAVIFRHANGHEESKTLFKHSIEYEMLWRDKCFAHQPGTSNPMIYNEVTN